MSRASHATWILSGALLALVLSAFVAPPVCAQGGFGMALQTVARSSPFPTDWQRTNTLANMSIFNSMGETVSADIRITVLRGGVPVGSTPAVPQTYPDGTTLYTTPQVTDWRTIRFHDKVGDAVDESGHLPDGFYQVCVDISNIRTPSGNTATDVSQCGQFLAIFPKPPTLLVPPNETVVSVSQPIFQWTPVVSQVGRVLTYWFRLVEVLPGQTSLQAIEANRSIYEFLFNGVSSFPYPASAPVLLEGRRYAWRVQALYPVSSSFSGISVAKRVSAAGTPAVIPIGENEGRSKVFTFTWTSDPRRAAQLMNGTVGPSGAPDARVGSAWGVDDSESAARAEAGSPAGRQAVSRGAIDQSTRSGGAGQGANFADRLARVMASLWKKGPGAVAAAARAASGHGAAAEAALGIGAPGATDGRQGWRETVDARIAQGPTGMVGATEPEGVVPPPPETAGASSAAATAADSSDAAPVQTVPQAVAPPSLEPPGFGPDWSRLHGTASVSSEAYSRDGSGAPTRPDRSARVVSGLSVGILKDRMRIPVSALVSGDQVSFRQNINQVAVAPRWQWAGVTAGNFSPQYSPYTLTDATILGGGFDLAPKRWRLGFVSGRARKAILPTLSAIVAPQFERNVTAGRIGYGDPVANTVEFSMMRATDDPNSIAGAESTLTLTPEGNTVYSMRAQGVLLKRHLRAQIETALSKYDRDRRADAPSVDGHAVGLQLFHETSLSRFGAKVEYLNGGFMTLGNSGITGDRVDLGVDARVQLLQGKLALGGVAGLRNDGVSTALAAETRRRNYGLNGSWQPDPRFGTDAQMSVYENESDAADSLLGGSTNTTRVYSVMPRVSWNVASVRNSLSGSAMIQKSRNGGGTGVFLNTNSLSVMANWSAMISVPWTVTFSGNYTKTDFDVAVIETSAFGPGFNWVAFRSKLLTSAVLQFTRSRTGNAGADTEVTPQMEMRWEFAPRQALVLRGNFRRFQYADPVTPEFNERVASLEYVTNL